MKTLPYAIGLNFLFPGLGYIYLDKPGVGASGILAVVVLFVAVIVSILPVALALGLLFGMHILMAIDMMVLFNKRQTLSTKQCPECAETIQKQARVCRFCKAAQP